MCSNKKFPERGDKEAIEFGKDFTPKFLPDGTIPAITVDAETKEILMFAYMNKESLTLSIQTGVATYWSRSRSELWRKGQTSGNEQVITEMLTDCDQDVIMIKVRVNGHGASCHNGYKSCFYRKVDLSEKDTEKAKLSYTDASPLFDPKDVY